MRVALRKLVSSSPSAATPSSRVGSSTSGRPCSATARMMVAQPTPRSRATAVTAWASVPTRRHASARARSGQHRPRADRGQPLGPGPHSAGLLPAAPDPLAPAQHHRPATDRQVTHPDRPSAVRGGRHPAAHAADHHDRGLDDQLPLATHELARDELEAVQAEQPGARRTTVLTHLGPPSCWTSDIRKLCEAPGAVWQPYSAVSGTPPRFMTKSHLSVWRAWRSRESFFYSLPSDATSPHNASTPGFRVLAWGAVLR